MKTYILNQRRDEAKHNAVGKAMTDVFSIMDRQGVKVMPGVPKDAAKALKVFDLVILTGVALFTLKKGDKVIFVYQDNGAKIKLLRKLSNIKKFTVICLVNDVNSIRSDGLYSDKRKSDIDNDFNLIGSSDIILAPNEGSKAFMLERGMKNEIIPVRVWDYLMDEEMGAKCDELSRHPSVKNRGSWRIGFAGNLGKSDFLDELDEIYDETLEYHLWGEKENRKLSNNGVIYEGSVSPSVLPLEIAEKSDFGLVWDGSSAHHIEGGYGEYLRFNNSHKCGCYLASGIPVFVFSGSGMAHFVKEEACGYTIDGLDDIAGILGNMTQEEYEKVCDNARRVAAKIRRGDYLTEALEKAGLDISSQS